MFEKKQYNNIIISHRENIGDAASAPQNKRYISFCYSFYSFSNI